MDVNSPEAAMWSENMRLKSKLDLCMIGGNHLASHLIGQLGGDFATRYPPSMSEQDVLQQLGPQYDCWTCWACIMRARDSSLPKDAKP